MSRNYFKIGLRNLSRHKAFSFINIAGLAAGMAATLLILLWAQDELSYDRFFKDSDHIYLVLRGDRGGPMAVTSMMLAPALKERVPEIKEATYFAQLPASYKFLIQNGEKGFEESVILASSNFFDVFSLKLKEGNPSTSLSDPNSIILDEKTAQKYFGDQEAIGKSLDVSGLGHKTVMKVSAVLEDIPLQSEIQSHIILPASWLKSIGMNFKTWDSQSFYTYVETKNDVDLQSLSAKIRQCEIDNLPNEIRNSLDPNTDRLTYSLLPLTKVHLFGGNIKFLQVTGDIAYVRIFIAIAVVILLIASINYMNLSTALSLKRRKEIAVKKTIGASRRRLMVQFLGESLIVSSIAFIVAMLFVELFLPAFNALSGKRLAISYWEPSFIILSLTVIVVTGLASGFYPALLLSSFSPVEILRKHLKFTPGRFFTRSALVFSICGFHHDDSVHDCCFSSVVIRHE